MAGIMSLAVCARIWAYLGDPGELAIRQAEGRRLHHRADADASDAAELTHVAHRFVSICLSPLGKTHTHNVDL